MKKFLLLLFAFVALQNIKAQSGCTINITNYNSVCVSYGPPQVFTITFTVTSSLPADSVVIKGYAGVITGQGNPNVSSYKIPLTNNTANVTLTLTRTSVFPNFSFAIYAYKGGVVRCSLEKIQTISTCTVPPPCFEFKNFVSTCIKVTPTSQIQLDFDLVVNQPIDSVLISSYAGTITGQQNPNIPKYKLTPTGTTTHFTLLLNQTTATTSFPFAANAYKNGTIKCASEFTFPLMSCTQACLNTWVNLRIFGQYAYNISYLNTYPVPYIYVGGNLAAGNSNVVKEETTISSVQRRTNCGGVTGGWQNINSNPLTAAQIGGFAGTGYTNTNTSFANTYPTPFNNTGGHDFTGFFSVPTNKLSTCSEDYKFTLRTCVTFSSGCTQCVTYPNLIANRP